MTWQEHLEKENSFLKHSFHGLITPLTSYSHSFKMRIVYKGRKSNSFPWICSLPGFRDSFLSLTFMMQHKSTSLLGLQWTQKKGFQHWVISFNRWIIVQTYYFIFCKANSSLDSMPYSSFVCFNIFSLLIYFFSYYLCKSSVISGVGAPKINIVPNERNHLSSPLHVIGLSPNFNITDSNILP